MKRIGFSLLTLLTCLSFSAKANLTGVTGVVTDKATGEPLAYVSIGFTGTNTGGLTDELGHFSLETPEHTDSIRVFMVGYKELRIALNRGTMQTLNLSLEEQNNTLEEVSILAKNMPRYRNKDNPAVALMSKVIDSKDQNYDKGKTTVAYDEYEKLQVSLLRSQEKIKYGKQNRNALARMFEKGDTTKVSGKASLPVVVHEKVMRHEENKEQGSVAHKMIDEKRTSLDGIVDDDGMEAYLDKMYVAADIYDNNIVLGDQQLLSPVAGLAPQFYKYFITDTLLEEGRQKVRLSFYPRNKTDLLFKGELIVDLQDYAVTEVNLTVNKAINLNWVDDLKIHLLYQKSDNGAYYLRYSSLGMAMSILGKHGGFYGEKVKAVKDYRHNRLPPVTTTYAAAGNAVGPHFSEADWQKYRPQTLSMAEQNVYANLDSLKQTSSFKRSANALTLLLSGYEVLGPVEVGPVNSFYSYNPVEGSRIKLGGRTTDKFNSRWMIEGHGAYGFRDKKWKYSAGLVYSLAGKPVAVFPMRNISAHHSYETQIPGQDLTFIEEDNFLLSFKRGDNDKWLYNNKWNLEYVHETRGHFAFKAGFTHSIQRPAGALTFRSGIEETEMRTAEHIILSEFSGEIRWAPHEQFYQGKKFRRPVFNAWPVFTLRGTVGVKGLVKSEYQYQSLTLNAFKRFYLSQLGFSDVALEGGRIFGSVPYPLLYIHKANQSYAYQLQSYNLMNFMEFVSDRYISLNIDHSFNGFFLNKIPLIRKLKLREVASFKALYGDLGDNNTPGAGDDGLFHFPTNRDGQTVTHALDQGPYMEGSIGISNIFKVLRVDAVKRFPYLHHPGVTSWGIRARMVLSL